MRESTRTFLIPSGKMPQTEALGCSSHPFSLSRHCLTSVHRAESQPLFWGFLCPLKTPGAHENSKHKSCVFLLLTWLMSA